MDGLLKDRNFRRNIRVQNHKIERKSCQHNLYVTKNNDKLIQDEKFSPNNRQALLFIFFGSDFMKKIYLSTLPSPFLSGTTQKFHAE